MKYSTKPKNIRTCRETHRFYGVNRADDPTALETDMMSQCGNLWSHAGILENRPGFVPLENGAKVGNTPLFNGEQNYFPHRGFFRISGEKRNFGAVVNLDESTHTTQVYLIERAETGTIVAVKELFYGSAMGNTYHRIQNLIFLESKAIKGIGVFALIAREIITENGNEPKVDLYEREESGEWVRVSQTELYRPVMYYNCAGANQMSAIDNGIAMPVQQKGEEINLLNGGFRVGFVCDGYSSRFVLPKETKITAAMGKFRITYIRNDGEYVFTVGEGKTVSNTLTLGAHSVHAEISFVRQDITFYEEGDKVFPMPRLYYGNSLIFEAYDYKEDKAFEAISGVGEPLLCEDRMFYLCGGASAHCLAVSAKENPLYIPGNLILPIGNRCEGVTALAMQNQYAVILKENSVYRMSVAESKSYDMENYLADTTAFGKTAALSVKIGMVNDHIGCDCPRTVALCFNRLVWYHSDGSIYTLYGSNRYTEGSVYELSSHLGQLKPAGMPETGSVFAAQLGGYYVLALGKEIYLMDTSVSGFRYLSGYRNSDSTVGGLCVFRWEFPKNCHAYAAESFGGNPIFLLCGEKGKCVYAARLTGDRDTVYHYASQSSVEPQAVTQPIAFTFASAAMRGEELSENRWKRVKIRMKNEKPIFGELFGENARGGPVTIPASRRFRTVTMVPGYRKETAVGVSLFGEGSVQIASIEAQFGKDGWN